MLEAEMGCRVRKKADYETKLNGTALLSSRFGTVSTPNKELLQCQGVSSVVWVSITVERVYVPPARCLTRDTILLSVFIIEGIGWWREC